MVTGRRSLGKNGTRLRKWFVSLAAIAARLLPGSFKRAIYRLGPLAPLIRNQLNRSVPAGIHPVTIAGGQLAGMTMALDLSSEKDYWLGTYELDLQDAISTLVNPAMIAYDVGANIGYISLLLARRVAPAGKVFAFEALPANLDRLRQNVRLNNLESVVHVVPAAVVDQAGPVTFLVGPSDDMGKVEGSAGREGVKYSDRLSLEGVSLDEFVFQQGNPAAQVVKMYIEGGEVLAMPGMLRLLQEVQPLIFLELHGPEAARVAWDLLTQNHYRIFRMRRGFPPVDSFSTLDWKSYLVASPAGHRPTSPDHPRSTQKKV